ncbi:hypothetical protein ASPWEDRAFT_117382 [Aspergillus wentii DTO 134E9]|uniref:HAUS augmin-like complex subunit 6 N-terminal domain-containing protein n=1 Tax=Aspergillus wentii DTO 134E9 TaxID=1073089 RepID=A0A1L9RBL4_ASPWE|nr:uncharacterized protein ASPWEDRAFT_117382 [Aspergillus wentii DTO 134E9]KAI9934861.1 hypothetical protein MW887_000481 [Aspergillus wentii]OJJ32300.1 hypothetical protein ASPWEDRAFT_117382 [Aspergillus wentii DTO 134E9]
MQSSRPPSRSKALNWTPSSHVTVFIRNLKLLRLDSQEDWPDITVRSLSPSSQNQRQRIKVVEWALYNLVAIWDPNTAHDKLRPFFPPLEPLQSVNLRAALFRVLTELKKNGDLGRETILRKSMLDDCKGDRFDELLAVFSTAVLRRALTATAEQLPNPALRLSTAKGITPEDYQLMVPLILAHTVSLGAMGDRRAHVRLTYDQFSELLDSKKVQLANRANDDSSTIPGDPKNFDTLAQEIRSNWLGSEEWAETLLYGGSQSSSDAFLEFPFSEAWSRAKKSSVEDLSASSAQDLLVDLESRVSRQRDRLDRWREFSASIQNAEDPGSLSSGTTSNSTPLVFRDHQALNIASISRAVRQPVNRTCLRGEDQKLLSSMNEALARISGKSNLSGRAAPPLRVPAVETDTGGRTSSLASPEPNTFSPEETGSEIAESPTSYSRASSPIVQVSSEVNPDKGYKSTRSNTFTLVERTRKSMSLVPPMPTTRSRESLAPRSSRASFPVNQFETPQKQGSHRYDSISRASTPQDELFKEEADYSSVFKSRPRVAHSPIASPAVHFSPMDDFDLNADTDINQARSSWAANGDYSELDLTNSPSRRRRF